MPELEVKAKLFEMAHVLSMYLWGRRLSEGGNMVYLFCWDEKPLIENLGSGTVEVAAALFGSRETADAYGNVVDSDIAKILRIFLIKFMSGDAMQLYNNEIKGVNNLNWKAFPQALIVSDKKMQCGRIEDRLSEVKNLLEFCIK